MFSNFETEETEEAKEHRRLYLIKLRSYTFVSSSKKKLNILTNYEKIRNKKIK